MQERARLAFQEELVAVSPSQTRERRRCRAQHFQLATRGLAGQVLFPVGKVRD